MPDLPAISIPDEVLEQSAKTAETRDYYANLTPEEKASEGIPVSDPKPEAKPKPEPEPKPEVEPEPEPEPETEPAAEADDEEDSDIRALFREVADMKKDLRASLGRSESAEGTKQERDELIDAALQHEDPVVRGMAQRLKTAESRVNEMIIERQMIEDNQEFDAVQESYLIGGKPMTDKQVEVVERYIYNNPDVGTKFSIEQITRALFPDAEKKVSTPPAGKGPGGNPKKGDGQPVATIVTEGVSGGALPESFKPRPNETVESAVEAAGKAFGW